MNKRLLTNRCPVAGALILLLSGCGTNPTATEQRVAEIMGQSIAREEIEQGLHSEQAQRIRASAPNPEAYSQWAELEPTRALRRQIWRPLLDRYMKQHALYAEQEEIAQYQRAHANPTDHHGIPRERAIYAIEQWKLNHALFTEFGGRVYRTNTGHLESIDAYFAYYRACEEEGLFSIFDKDLRDRFYDFSWEIARYTEELAGDEAARAIHVPIWMPAAANADVIEP